MSIKHNICGHKENYKSRADLKEANAIHQYKPWENVQQLLDAHWILSKEEKSVFKKSIETICTPTKTMHCKGTSPVQKKEH